LKEPVSTSFSSVWTSTGAESVPLLYGAVYTSGQKRVAVKCQGR
jgi:hypothetical protein